MPRKIDTTTLANAATDYARMFLSPDRKKGDLWVNGPSRVMQDLYNAAYRDEHDYLRDAIREELGKRARDRFDALAAKKFTPRKDAAFEAELAARLGQTLDGDHREGAIGRVVVGQRYICHASVEVEAPWSIQRRKARGLPLHVADRDDRELITKIVPYYWPIYAGEAEERERPDGVADAIVLPPNYHGMGAPRSLSAASMGISNEAALLACDAVVDLLDEGSGAAVMKGYEAARATDVDTAVGAQTLGFTLVCTDPAFGAAADAAPGGTATAAAITDDSSADATITLAWLRVSATNDGATPLDDHIDGNAGTSGEDYNFNTVSIVAGAVVSMTSWTVTMLEAPA
jgi:hypothetical protein